MTTRRRLIPERPRIFLGCEGESEVSYGRLLSHILEEQERSVYIDAVPLALGAGNPLLLAKKAAKRMRERERDRGKYVFRALLIDTDKLAEKPAHRQEVEVLCSGAKIHVIWQAPCHEALLLRHLPRCGDHRPQTTPDAKSALEKQWPAYQKPAPASKLREKIDAAAVRQAARVEPLLQELLSALGFI